MRDDNFGLFWEDQERERGRGSRAPLFNGEMPSIPHTGWERPTGFPELRNEDFLCIDLETYDPELKDCGPGWARGRGRILGIAVGTKAKSYYYPIAHEVCPEENLDRDKVLAWFSEQMSNKKQAKMGANIIYDVGWLAEEGVEVKGPIIDVQYAGALLAEDEDVGLETLANKYIGDTKKNEELEKWLQKWAGRKITGDIRQYLYKAPPSLVGPYAEGDVDLPRRIFEKQWPELYAQGLADLFDIECRLIPLWIAMRRQGVTIDVTKAERAQVLFQEREDEQRVIVNELAGFEVNTSAAVSMAKAFDVLGLEYGLTETGKPKMTKGFLEGLNHPFTNAVIKAKEYEKARTVFIESYLLKNMVGAKVYGQFHSLRGRDGGTRSGRCASSTPNLQNIPSRDEFIGPIVRSCFVPDCGHKQWRRYDFSQIEYRFLAHFAMGPGADALRAQYQADPLTDYHKFTQDLILQITGKDLGRKATKTVNFGLVYGMSEYRLASDLHIDAKELFQQYHTALPFVKTTMDWAMEQGQRTGMARTILGRISRFDYWVPNTKEGKNMKPLKYNAAYHEYGPGIKRAFTHKCLNRILQGSAADQLKVGMLACWEQGIFDRVGVPRLTVHDELDFSDSGEASEDDWHEMKLTLERALPIKVPVIMDGESGPSWGECE